MLTLGRLAILRPGKLFILFRWLPSSTPPVRTGTVVTDQPLKLMHQIFIGRLTVFIVRLTVREDLYVICCKCRQKKSNEMQHYADNYYC